MIKETRKLVKTQLDTLKTTYGIKNVYYGQADDNALYPHIVFYFDEIKPVDDDNNRLDYKLIIDIWNKGSNTVAADEVADSIIKLLNKANLPQTSILPTFYFEAHYSVIDEDKTIKHNQLKFIIQNYER